MDNNIRYEEELCFKLKMDKDMTRKEIAKETGLTPRQVKTRLADYYARFGGYESCQGVGGNIGKIIADSMITDEKLSQNDHIEIATTIDNTSIDWEPDKVSEQEYFAPPEKDASLFQHEKTEKHREEVVTYIEDKYSGEERKALYLADLHVPFTNYNLVKHIVKTHDDADFLVINGDFLDLFAVSKFAKDKDVALKREMREARHFLEFVSDIFEDVIITEGNHERRLKTYLRHAIPTDMQFLFEDDILKYVVSGKTLNKEPLENVHVIGSWWVKVYDTIFAHPDNFSSVPMRTSLDTSQHFLMLQGIPHRTCVIGHTHQVGELYRGEVKCMETGCLCYDMDYRKGAKFNTKNRWKRGHALIYFDKDGNSLHNKSRVISFSQ